MALKARLDLRQSQSLVMTPQLQQAIKLLQFNNIELSNFIDSELLENPLLERADPGQTYAESGDSAVGNGDDGIDQRTSDNFTDRDDQFGTDRLTASETMGAGDSPHPIAAVRAVVAAQVGAVVMNFPALNKPLPMKQRFVSRLMISSTLHLPMQGHA